MTQQQTQPTQALAGITFAYESDGDAGRNTYYVVASHAKWADDERLDFPTRRLAQNTRARLAKGEIDMDQAAEIAGSKWL